MKAYLDLANGVSGDMLLAALAHAGRKLGLPAGKAMSEAVSSLGLGCRLSFIEDNRRGIACLRAEVETSGSHHSPEELLRAVKQATAEPTAIEKALATIEALVSAESRVHGTATHDVHLHELGSADTAADALGAAVGFSVLDINELDTAAVPVPSGWIESGHGPLPLPAPATLELLAGAALQGVPGDKELVTPSGIAILVAHGAKFGRPVDLVLQAVGIGGGTRDTERPNICRLLVGHAAKTDAAPTQACVLLETNIDDQTPQALAHATQSLLDEGALDAWVTPVVMKKSRPAFLLSVLTKPEDEELLVKTIFRLTPTLGVRRRATTRYALDREEVTVEIGGQNVRVKVARMSGEVVNLGAEFDDCVAACGPLGLAPSEVAARAVELARAVVEPNAAPLD